MTNTLTIQTTRGTEIVINREATLATFNAKGQTHKFNFSGEVKYLSRLGYHIELGPITAQITSETADAINAFFLPNREALARRAAEYANSAEGFSDRMNARMSGLYSNH